MEVRESCVDLRTPAIVLYPERCRQLDSCIRDSRGLQLIRSREREYIPVRGEEAVEFGINGCTGIANARTVRSAISRTTTKKLGGAGLPALRRPTAGACHSRS